MAYMAHLLVPFGGLRSIGLEAGETVVVCPATGGYGGAATQVAVAMRARVLAMGRNEGELRRLKKHVKRGTEGACVEIVTITGDVEDDAEALMKFGMVDAVFDISPPAAAKSTHLKSAVKALRKGGRVSLMGYVEDFGSDSKVMADNTTLRGRLMYERGGMLLFVKMLERGLFPRGEEFVDTKTFGLEDWEECLDVAAEHTGAGRSVVSKL